VLVPDVAEQEAIARIHELRQAGATLFKIRDQLREMGFAISHDTARQVLARGAAA
jgi:hypothetical protein